MARNEVVNETIFGQETEFDGHLSFTDNLVITGKFNGTIEATGDLVIDKSSVCTVDRMSARSVVVYGRVTGDLEGAERIELCKGSKVKGDITTANLRIADNVEFEGQISQLAEVPDVDLFSVASAEFKSALVHQNGNGSLL